MTDKNPLAHYSGVLSEAVQERAAATGKAAQPSELISTLWEAIGHHSAQVAETGEMAPGQKLLDAARAVEMAIRPPAIATLPEGDYLEGVNIPNLREALIFLGRENGVGEGEVGDKLAQYVNSVVSGVLSKKATLRESPHAAPAAVAVSDAAINEVLDLVKTYTKEALNYYGFENGESTAETMKSAWHAIQFKLRALLAGVSAPAAQAVEPTDAELIALNAGECYFGESPSKYPELGHGTQYHAGAPGVLGFARAALALRSDPAAYSQKFQQRVQPWMMTCFGPEISADHIERNHRFLEESLELVQSLGCTASEAHQLVDYVFGRPAGEPAQEAGGVMVTLAALCLASGLDMHACGETELARIWTKVEAIRAKQAAKPKHSPLPMHAPQAQADARDAEQERWMEIGKAIERACIDQPDSTEIVISLERDAGTVTMFDPDGNEHDQFSHEDGFAGVVNAAIEAAIAAAKGE